MSDPQNENMTLWRSVEKTDPKHTKQVNQRGGFTSIDAMYQIMRATEQWGPVGKGWYWEARYETLIAEGGSEGKHTKQTIVFADVYIYWGRQEDREAYGYGPVRGSNVLVNDKGRYDEDAPKKAMTDALTKALSHLGFSADVFFGQFDIPEYVEGLKREFGAKKAENDPAIPETVKAMLEGIREAKSVAELTELWTRNDALRKELDRPHRDLITMRFKERGNQLKAGADPAPA